MAFPPTGSAHGKTEPDPAPPYRDLPIEPEANTRLIHDTERLNASIAISLKRIADIVAPVALQEKGELATQMSARIAELEELIHSTLGGIYGRADLPDGTSIVVGHLDRGGITVTRPNREPVRIGQ